MSKPMKNQRGDRFGKLVLIRVGPNLQNGRSWYCLCDCGKEKLVSNRSLINGCAKSCGCFQIEFKQKKAGHVSYWDLYKRYKRGASKRNLCFDLKFDEFRAIVDKNCFYCNASPKPYNKYLRKDMVTPRGRETSLTVDRATIFVNGVDRVQNCLGYTNKNCVSCCFRCNDWKSNLSQKEFISHIYKIFTFFKNP